ncbi:hypothetical protein R1sor_017135 [Riccia sorocarpa]|uniref:Uncharacterized protein n=1 Tax=Riccia sorocarpa TaxID=122646 RepID=A0ABD3I6C4_9MARC
MTRPPRPKYPSDAKNYHDLRCPGFAHMIRLPEELLQPYVNLKRALDPRTTHTDVIRFLFEAAEAAIQAVMQSDNVLAIPDSQEEGRMDDLDEADPDDTVGNVAADSEDSDLEVLDETGRTAVTSVRLEPVVIKDSQAVNPELIRVVLEASNAIWSKTERNHGTPDVTGHLNHWSLCAGMTHSCLESLCQELDLHVPRKAHFFEFQSDKKRKSGWKAAALDLWHERKIRLQDDLLRRGSKCL